MICRHYGESRRITRWAIQLQRRSNDRSDRWCARPKRCRRCLDLIVLLDREAILHRNDVLWIYGKVTTRRRFVVITSQTHALCSSQRHARFARSPNPRGHHAARARGRRVLPSAPPARAATSCSGRPA